MKRVFSLIALVVPYFASAQKDSLLKKDLCIKVSPFALIDPWKGTCTKLGAEFGITKYSSVYLEYGHYFPKFNITNIDHDHKGFTTELQAKFYEDRMDGVYWAVVLSYTKQSYNRKDSIELLSNPTPTTPVIHTKYTKEYNIAKEVSGLGLNVGELYHFNKIFFIDGWVGAGLKLGNVSCTLTDEEAYRRILGDWTNPTLAINRCGQYVIPYFSFGIKFGCMIP